MYDLAVKRLSRSLTENLAARMRQAARAEGTSLSEWLRRAAETQLLLRNAADVITAWEQEHGEITQAELAAVEAAWRG